MTMLFIFSGECYSSQMRPHLAETPRRRKPHSIQMVDVPATPDNRRGLHFSIEKRAHESRISGTVDLQTALAPQLKIFKYVFRRRDKVRIL